MTKPEPVQQPRSTTIVPLGGVRLAGPIRLARRLVHIALIGGMDLDLSQAQVAGAQLDIVKFSRIGGVSLVVPADVRVEVGGFVLLGGKDIERRSESSDGGRILRVRA